MQMTAEAKIDPQAVLGPAKKGSYNSIRHAAASIRKEAIDSIEKVANKRKASEPGTPPHTHRKGWYKRALRFHAHEDDAVIGFMHSVIGLTAQTHEFGLEEDDQRFYPERPTIGPALERMADRLLDEWRGSIG
jgi:hypothetical protein